MTLATSIPFLPMIAPREDLEFLSERPRLNIGWHIKLYGRLFRRYLKPWRDRVHSRCLDKLETLLAAVSRCETRQEIEEILGLPKYAMHGNCCGVQLAEDSEIIRPDCVEVYESDELSTEIWFKDGKSWRTSGYITPNGWDIVCSDAYWDDCPD